MKKVLMKILILSSFLNFNIRVSFYILLCLKYIFMDLVIEKLFKF